MCKCKPSEYSSSNTGNASTLPWTKWPKHRKIFNINQFVFLSWSWLVIFSLTFDPCWLIFSMTFHPYWLIFFITEGIILHGVFGRLETESVIAAARLAHPAWHVWRHPPFSCKGSGCTYGKHVWKLIFTERVISGWCEISGSLGTIFYSFFLAKLFTIFLRIFCL